MLATFLVHLRQQWMGALALFLVLAGGTAWAVDEWTGSNIVDGSLTSADYKNNDIRSGDVRANSLTDADINELTLGEVPSAADADFAQTALNAFNANSAEDANNLDGLDSSDFVRSAGASFTSAGLSDSASDGTCTATNVWQDWKPNELTEVGYWRDESGIVHLRGTAIQCGNPTGPDIPLPPGYGPARSELVGVPGPGFDSVGRALIQPDGVHALATVNESILALGGVTFRCGPSGQDGCP